VKRILYIIGLTLLLSNNLWALDKKPLKVDVLAKTNKSWDGAILPSYPQGKPEITILRIIIPPGTTLPLHKHPVINAGVVIKGELTVITEEKKTLYLKAGDSIVEVVNTWHFGKNEGKEPVDIIVFYAGTENSQVTIKK
jgi:quercetin dioxygenase-like cupin family protein